MRTIERGRTAAVLMAVAMTALLFFTPSHDNFNLPKMVWVKTLTAVLAVLTVTRLAAGGDLRLRVHWLNLALFLYVAWKAASWFWAQSRSLAADDIRWWATLLLWCLLFQDWLGPQRQRLMLVGGALAISALLLSLWLLLQDFAGAFYEAWVQGLMQLPDLAREPLRALLDRLTGGRALVPKLPDWRGRLWAGLGNTNHIADYLAMLYPMIAMQYLMARGKMREIVTLGTLVAAYAALIACYSVGSNGGLILAGLVMLALLIRNENREFWRRRALRISVLLVLLGGVTAFYVLPSSFNPHPGGIFGQAFASQRWKEGWPTRLAIWLTSVEMIRQHPLLGIGAGNFTYGYTATLSPRVLNDPDLTQWAGVFTNAAHNEPLQAWVETGVVGLGLLLSLWVLIARSALKGLSEDKDDERRLRAVVLAMLVAVVGHSMMNFTLQLPTSSLLFVGLIGAAASLGRRDEFPLTVRSPYLGFEVDLETTGMRRIESIGLTLVLSAKWRAAVAVVAVAVGAAAIARSMRLISADALFNRARRAQMTGLPNAAEDLARRALAVNPNHHHARKLLGRVLLERGHYGEARQALEKVIERETVFDFFGQLGWACWRMGDREAAGRAWATYFGRCPMARQWEPQLFALFTREFPELAAQLPTSAATQPTPAEGLK